MTFLDRDHWCFSLTEVTTVVTGIALGQSVSVNVINPPQISFSGLVVAPANECAGESCQMHSADLFIFSWEASGSLSLIIEGGGLAAGAMLPLLCICFWVAVLCGT